MSMEVLIVGRRYPRWRGQPDAYRVGVTDGGILLEVVMRGVTNREKRDFQGAAPLDVRFIPVDPIGFFVFRFGNQPWGDAPYSPGLLPDRTTLQQIPDDAGLALHVTLADSTNGELVAQHMIGLGTEFSRFFANWFNAAPQIDHAAYDQAMTATFSQHSSEQLAEMAPTEARFSLGRE